MNQPIDPNGMADVIEQMVRQAMEKVVTRTYKRGIVSAVSGTRADVKIDGSTVATQNIICLAHYTPVVADKVLVVSIGETGANLVVIGKLPA